MNISEILWAVYNQAAKSNGYEEWGKDDKFLDVDEATQQLATLINDIVGADEPLPKDLEERVYVVPSRNQLRAEIRTKLKQAGLPMEGDK